MTPTLHTPASPTAGPARVGGSEPPASDRGAARTTRQRAVVHRVVRDLAGAATVAVLVAAFGNGQSSRVRLATLAFVLSIIGSMLAHRRLVAAALLPLMRSMFDLVGPLIGFAALQGLLLLEGYPFLDPRTAVLAPVVVYLISLAVRRTVERATPATERVLMVGPGASADRLARNLRRVGVSRFSVLGWVGTPADAATLAPRSRCLGPVEALTSIVKRERADMVLVDDDLSLSDVLDELAAAHVDRHLDVLDVTSFSERVFGHVPLSSLRTAWFRFVLDPNFRQPSGRAKRLLDLSLAAPIAFVTAPVLALLALLVRLDGGPALFRQERIGLSGRPFELYKLRSMRVTTDAEARWSSAADDRVTRIGRFLRRSHLDELPQLLNVIKGDMSLVGPRPEQPMLVLRLEESLPYYDRRHTVRPGITGWAQVRCGYSGTNAGSAWKLSHDLYYLKHRSFTLDLLILSETLRTLVADRQYGLEPTEVAEILGTE